MATIAALLLLAACEIDSQLLHVARVEGETGAPASWDSPAADERDTDEADLGDDETDSAADVADVEPEPQPGACASFESGVVVGHLPPELDEVSGLVASRTHPGVLWALEDSGNAAEIYALDIDGTLLATISLPVPNIDWEELAIAPCGEVDCLTIADVGDNNLVRDDAVLYRLTEPAVADGTASVETIRLRYAAGPQNVEAVVVDAAGAATLFSKRSDGSSEVLRESGGYYRSVATLSVGTPGEAEWYGRVTGASLWPDDKTLLLRSYGHAWRYDLDEHGLAGIAGSDRSELDVVGQEQVEAVAWDAAIGGWWQTTEGVDAALVFSGCDR
ncbi:MAG: hypothetical protein EXR71_14990 [Myxococcales bacterium]|nr:hypothetical protein [Myxococcales bacterium]